MKTLKTQGIILQRTNFGEADRILQLLTPEGTFGVMARGVRREKSKLAGGIELFAVSDVVLGEGKGDLRILVSARLKTFYRHILEEYERLEWGYWVIGCVRRESNDVATDEWYAMLVEVLAALDQKDVPLPLVQAWFFVRVAAVLGADLNTARDVAGTRLAADMTYRYDEHERGFVSATNGAVTAEHIKILRLLATQSLATIVHVGGLDAYMAACVDIARRHAALD